MLYSLRFVLKKEAVILTETLALLSNKVSCNKNHDFNTFLYVTSHQSILIYLHLIY
jgi:hypothetical protein